MPANLRPVQIVNDAFLLKMLRSPIWLLSFPFLNSYAAALKNTASCGSCKGYSSLGVDLTSLKKTIAGLPEDMRLKFKSLAAASQVVVYHRNSAGKVVPTTF